MPLHAIHDDETVEKFSEDPEKATDEQSYRYHIIMGGLNAKMGVILISTADNMKWVGPFWIASRNERGKRLLDFAEESILVIIKRLETGTWHGKPQGEKQKVKLTS